MNNQPYSSRAFVSLREVASYIGVSALTVRRYLSDPDPLVSYKIGRRRVFKLSDVDAWIERRRAKPAVDVTSIVDNFLDRRGR